MQALPISQNATTAIATPSAAAANATPVNVSLTYALASTSAATSHATARAFQSISAGNTLLSITVTPLGGAPSTFGPSVCTAASCAISFTALPGPNTIAFTFTDAASHKLATFSTTQIIQPHTATTLKYTANPVVDHVNLNLATLMPSAGVASDDVLTVSAIDASGSTIAGTGNYVDSTGKPLALMLSVNNVQDGGTGTVSIQGPTRLTAPSQTGLVAHYDGRWLDHSVISVTSTLPISGTLGTATLTTTPTAYEYNQGGALGNLSAITTGPDGALWFVDISNDLVGRITTAGVYTNLYSAPSEPNNIVTGSDGNLWVSEQNSNTVRRLTVSGSPTVFSSGISGGAYLRWVTPGPDGNIWFTERVTSKIGRITTQGVVSEYSANLTAGGGPEKIITGPDGNLWFSEYLKNKIGRITPQGIISEFSSGITAGATVEGIASGSDGNIWFTERSGNRIGRCTPSGVITEFSTGLSAGADPVDIVSGPDGKLWFGEDNGNKIGSITTSGLINEYGTGITGGASPQWVTFGPDGNLWFTEYSGARVGKFVF